LCRNCLLKHVVEGKIEEKLAVKERRRGWRQQLLEELKERRGHWKLKEEALIRITWRTRLRTGCALSVRQTAEWMTSKRTHSVPIRETSGYIGKGRESVLIMRIIRNM
jgi:hypothetical protein